jgi:hypothetical protein
MDDQPAPDLSHIAAGLRGLAVPCDSLTLDPANARRHPAKNLEAVRASLRVYGQRKPLVVNRRTSAVEAGNGTLEAAQGQVNDPRMGHHQREPWQPRPWRRTGEFVSCGYCGTAYYQRRSESGRRYCSPGCANAARAVYAKQTRVCASCGREFAFTPKPRSNSAGRYCSLHCRNAGYLGCYHGRPARYVGGHRPGWASLSRSFRRGGNDFCAICGRSDCRLAVHHIEPYRVARDNRDVNLVTLCPRHHGLMERVSERIATWPESARRRAVLVIQGLLCDQYHLLLGLRLAAARVA